MNWPSSGSNHRHFGPKLAACELHLNACKGSAWAWSARASEMSQKQFQDTASINS